MKFYISERVLLLADYTIKNKATVRDSAKNFGVSKSTVHKDLTERLHELNMQLADEVKCILELNKAERHIRGGNATKKKYKV